MWNFTQNRSFLYSLAAAVVAVSLDCAESHARVRAVLPRASNYPVGSGTWALSATQRLNSCKTSRFRRRHYEQDLALWLFQSKDQALDTNPADTLVKIFGPVAVMHTTMHTDENFQLFSVHTGCFLVSKA